MEKNVSICATILFLYSRNYHNIVNLLYFNKIHLKHFFKRSQPDTLWQEDALGALSHRLALAVGRRPCETVSLSIQASGSDHSQRRDPASENRPAEPFLNPSSTNSWAKQHSGWFTPFSLGEPGIATECPVCQVIKSLKQELHPKTCQTLREARLGRPCPGQRWEQLDGISSRQHYQIPSGCWLWGAGVGVEWGASLVAQKAKNLPGMQETQFLFLDWEDPLEKGMATHSSILVWRIPCTEEPGGLHSMGSQTVRHD